jgi:hypothetical protein
LAGIGSDDPKVGHSDVIAVVANIAGIFRLDELYLSDTGHDCHEERLSPKAANAMFGGRRLFDA